MRSDQQIIERVLCGRAEEFRELMRRYQPALQRLVYGVLRRREESEDAVQESFLLAYQNLSSFRGDGGFWAWLRRIALNVCLKKLSPEFPSDEVEDLLESVPVDWEPVESQVLRRMEMKYIVGAIDTLPDAYRTVVVLRYLEDLSSAEIADILGKPASTVRVQLRRAIQMLCERLVVSDEL